ncbi:xanthine dehydrogenase family protein subunit M, partial [Mesorhizobium sp. M7A.T.Ca.TU.009.01.3.2]
MRYIRPLSIEDAVGQLAGSAGTAAILAGGSDLLVRMKGGFAEPELIVDIKAIDGLSEIRETAEGFSIGAAVPCAVLGENTALRKAWPGVVEAAKLIGSKQVQGRCTIVGNLCNASPAADGVPGLLILDAEVELRSVAATRHLPLQDFILGNRRTALLPGEMVTAIRVPKPSGTSAFVKLGARRYLVISIAMVAARLVVQDGLVRQAAVAAGSCSVVAKRLAGVEAALHGLP